MKPARKKIMLEIGPGWSPAAMKQEGYRRILVDSDADTLKSLQLRYGTKAEYVKADVKALPFKDKLASKIEARMMEWYCLEEPLLERSVGEMRRVLKDKGVVTLTVAWKDPQHYESLKEAFKKQGFELVEEKEMSKNPELIKKATDFEKGFMDFGRSVTLFKFRKLR
jgi:ubiquinone/menaquinone biosynthesis C-methylase UbiE